MPTTQLQDYLFQRIREQLPASASLADVVSGLLYISNDSAYRRIRGETGLVLEEVKTLCDHFSISLDQLLRSNASSVTFYYKKIDNAAYSFERYLSDILKNLEMAAEGEIIYLTKDIPVFYNFYYRPLFAFRYFFWMKSILQHPEFSNRKFSFDLLPASIEDLGKEIINGYNRVSSTEIWNTECINSTINQVEYYRDAGYFESEKDIGAIYESLISLMEHLRQQAEWGTKFTLGENPQVKKSNLQFFYNRLVLGDNTILVRTGDKVVLYMAFDVLNYMITQDSVFCNDILTKVDTLMRRATLLSNASDKQRNIFFNILMKKIPDPQTLKTSS